MPTTIFYSWQSDIKSNRAFIREALDDALAQIAHDASTEDALRDTLLADQDTQGVSGSPSIAETILAKIRTAYGFVADLTFVAERADGGGIPNPNVLLEYGYALHSLGDGRLITVMNEACGSPDLLPFDLAHKRWPIRFNLPSGGGNRAEEKRRLTQTLKAAIGSMINQYGEVLSPAIEHPTFLATEAADGRGMLRGPDDELAIRSDGRRINYQKGPYLYLRLIPSSSVRALSNVEAVRLVQQQSLGPLDRGYSGGHTARHRTGAVNYAYLEDQPELAYAATELFLTGEIWGWDTYYLRPMSEKSAGPYIPTGALETVYRDTLSRYLRAAHEALNLDLPVHVVVGGSGLAGFTLAVDQRYFFGQFAGNILEDHVSYEFDVTEWTVDVQLALKPFFELIYDAAGEIRPDV